MRVPLEELRQSQKRLALLHFKNIRFFNKAGKETEHGYWVGTVEAQVGDRCFQASDVVLHLAVSRSELPVKRLCYR